MRARIQLPTALALVAALLAGCGDRNMVVNVDVLSFIDPSLTRVAFGPVPAVPGGLYTGETALLQNAEVHMIQKPNSLAKVQSVALTIAAVVADSTGSGSDTLRVYMSDSATDPLTTPAVATLPVDLVDGQSDTLNVSVAGDQRVADLFDGTDLRLTVTTALRGPASGAPLNGRVQLSTLRATVIAGRKGL